MAPTPELERVWPVLKKNEQDEVVEFAVEKAFPGYELVKRKRKAPKERHSTAAQSVTLGGKEYRSISQACEATGINGADVSKAAQKYDVSRKEALEYLYAEKVAEPAKAPKVKLRQAQDVKPVEMTVGGMRLG